MNRQPVRRLPSFPLLRPAVVRPGATIGIVAPASPPADPDKLDAGVAVLEGLGYRVKLARHVRSRRGYLAGTDRERAGDVMRLFADRSVDAIIALRGGYGASRLLPLLDYAEIRRHAHHAGVRSV